MRKIMKIQLIVFLSSVIFIFNCGKKTNRVLADGSSTVFPVTSAAAEDFSKKNPDIHVTVGISGTGGGFKKFCNNETDISNASRFISEEEKKSCSKNQIEFIELPIAYDGIAVVVHKDNSWANELSIEDLKKIFQRNDSALKWKDVNPMWPEDTIKLFVPGQDSGTFDYFAEEIVKKKDNFRQKDIQFSEDDNTIVTGVSGNKGAIGFFGIAYYESNKDKLKLVKIVNPATKKAIEPNLETIKSNLYSPLSRPIFIYLKSSSLAKENVARFVDFYFENAARLSKETGYIPLQDASYLKIQKRYKDKITGSAVKKQEDKHKKLDELFL